MGTNKTLEQAKKDTADDGCCDVGALMDEIERLHGELVSLKIERLRKELEYAKLAAEAEARRVDALKAELDALKSQKPVAWAVLGLAVTQSEAEAARWESHGLKFTSLYAAPKPGEPT